MADEVKNNLSDDNTSSKFYFHISECLSTFMDRYEYSKKNPMTAEEFQTWTNK